MDGTMTSFSFNTLSPTPNLKMLLHQKKLSKRYVKAGSYGEELLSCPSLGTCLTDQGCRNAENPDSRSE